MDSIRPPLPRYLLVLYGDLKKSLAHGQCITDVSIEPRPSGSRFRDSTPKPPWHLSYTIADFNR